MKEIGGYIEFEHFHGDMLHDNAVRLNCGRNALAYLIRAKQIRKLAIPYFICDSVVDTARKYGAAVRFYHVTKDLRPGEDASQGEDEWLYLVNYYGQVSSREILELRERCPRVIVDNSQAYFAPPADNTDTLYSCRKFFGVSDGALLFTDALLDEELETDQSYQRYEFLMGRLERSASEFYARYVSNNHLFKDEPLKRMSLMTENLLHGIDYQYIQQKRTDNFRHLHELLGSMNQLDVTVPEGAFAYPLLLENAAQIRKMLIADKIYIPVLWPDAEARAPEGSIDEMLAGHILPIPCDQRYGAEEMEYISSKIRSFQV